MTVDINIFKAPGTDEEAGELLAGHMPQGRVWDKKTDPDANLCGLVRGLAATFMQIQQKIYELAEEFNINLTSDLLPEWETSVEIPDDCIFTFNTLVERRQRVIERLRNIPVVTLAELQTYIQMFFSSDTVTLSNAASSGGIEYTLEMDLTDGINHRFIIVADIYNASIEELVRCLLRQITPANVVIQTNIIWTTVPLPQTGTTAAFNFNVYPGQILIEYADGTESTSENPPVKTFSVDEQRTNYINFEGNDSVTLFIASGNECNGAIPENIFTLSKLNYLDLSLNDFTGGLSTNVGNLTSLEYLYLGSNGLDGQIPPEIEAMTSLKTLSMPNNNFSGRIPDEIGSLSALERLSLPGNAFNSAIPSEIGNLTNLTVLQLYNNVLTYLPTAIGNLTKLVTLRVEQNRLVGLIPHQVGNLTKLTHFDLSENLLAGPIPTQYGNLTELEYFSVADNGLWGSIPSELANLTSLESFYIYTNGISGVIPSEIAAFVNLEAIWLHDNSFSEADMSNFVSDLWANRVQLGSNLCSITVYDNNGLTADAVARIEGTGAYAGDGLIDAGCTVTYT